MAVAMAAALAPAEAGLWARLARSGTRPVEHWIRSLGGAGLPLAEAAPAPLAEVDNADAIILERVEADGGTAVDAAGGTSTAIASPTSLGRDVVFGGLACALHGVLTPFAEQVRRWLPADTPQGAQGVLDTAARAGESVIAFTAAGALSERFPALGRLVSGVPVLGSAGPLGSVSRAVLGHLVASLVRSAACEDPETSQIRAPAEAEAGEELCRRAPSPWTEIGSSDLWVRAPPFSVARVAAECALCGDDFVHGSRVQVLSCGHACLCTSPCAAAFLARQSDCPVCRRGGVFGTTSVRC
ncbi:unnamed protein product [Prorocentrum cordatum]|uniref:RING-type domain-containing protein n=1 Tax=Prorocentrum cordatum TaxID=2364126 RepID=A0ABN9X9H5_9DINO|nr:unnamed protein product [Polarella glacialis]